MTTTKSTLPGRRFLALGAGLLLAVPLVSAVGLATPAPRASAATATTETASPDFASEVYGDAWDYSDQADQNLNASSTDGIAIANGVLEMKIRGSQSFSPVSTVPGALNYGHDGSVLPVDTSRYKRLSFEMNQPASGGVGAFYWFTCPQQLASCAGGVTFGLVKGDHVYDIALNGASTIGAKTPWNGAHVVGLRMVPSITQSKSVDETVSFNWLRVYAPTGAAHQAYPAGSYSGFTVLPRPRPVVDTPNATQGKDVTTAEGRRQFDFTSGSVPGVSVSDATVKAYDSRGMTATNSGPHQNDPQVRLPIGAFPANTYHYLTFDLTYDGGFSLASTAGGGKLARLIWGVKGTTTAQQSNDIVTYSGVNAGPVTIDLAKGDPLDASSAAPRAGWLNQTITSLRFDPNEDPGANTWHLKSVHLRAQPTATGSTNVTFHDAGWVSGATADVAVADGGAYSNIASGVAVKQGENSVPFSLGSRGAGSYKVRVTIHHPDGSASLAYSGVNIGMTPDTSHNPSGSLDTVKRVPGGVSLAGWVRDPDTTSPVSVRFYDGANYFASTTGSIARSDVKKANPSAPLNTGYSTNVALGAGKHNICAYGINVGTGTNSKIGCKTITVSPAPIGRLDAIIRRGSQTAVAGWALDPDTASSINVRFYVNGTYVGQAPASGARSDIATAYPGYGAAHGYKATIPAGAGSTVCVYAIDSAGKSNTTLSCKKV